MKKMKVQKPIPVCKKKKKSRSKQKTIKFKKPIGQMKVKNLHNEVSVMYQEVDDQLSMDYYSINTGGLVKVPPTQPIILELSPDVVFVHNEEPPDSDFEMPVQNIKVELPDFAALFPVSESEEGGREDEEGDENLSEIYGGTDMENELEMGSIVGMEDVVSVLEEEQGEEEEMMEEEQEYEHLGSEPTWDDTLQQEKSLFNKVNDATQMDIEPMKTYALQSRLPNIAHLGGRFDLINTYDAYKQLEKVVKDAKEKTLSALEKFEKKIEEKEELENTLEAEGNMDVDLADITLGHHKTRPEGKEIKEDDVVTDNEENEDPYQDDEYLICEDSSGGEIDVDSGEGEMNSSSEEEIEEPKLEEEKDEEDEGNEDNKVHVKQQEEDIDGYDLLPEGFFGEDDEDDVYQSVTEKKPKRKKILREEKPRVRITIAQKEQIINHILNPFEYEPVRLTKDEDRDVDFDGPDSDDDDLDDGEYLLAIYGPASEKSEYQIAVPTDNRGSRAEEGQGEEEDWENEQGEGGGGGGGTTGAELEANLETKRIETLKKIIERHNYVRTIEKNGGIIIENKYKKIRGITKILRKRVLRLLANKKKVEGMRTKLKQVRLLRKLQIKRTIKEKPKFVGKVTKKIKSKLQEKRSKEKLPKQRKVGIIGETYKKEKRLYNMYVDEFNRLSLVTRLIHQKRYYDAGMDFKNFHDYEDKNRSLFPLKKMSFFASKRFRVTHMSWAYHLKHNLAISYESLQCAENSKWLEGYIVFYHPMANSEDRDLVFSFKCGVRCFDIAIEWANNGQVLVGLQDGNIQIIKAPFPNVLRATTVTNRHNSPVVQVLWMTDWYGKDLVDARGNIVTAERMQRFMSYAEDGVVKFWWIRRYVGMAVFKTIHLHAVGIPRDLEISYVKITCLGSDYHDRDFVYLGTEDGKIYKYNTMHAPQTFLCVLDAHKGMVNEIAVNYFNKDVFLSGGEDGVVKIWRGNGPRPLWTYFMQVPIASIKWSHFTSYVWAVATRDNYVRIYNLERHFHEPMTSQAVLSYSKCARIEFHHNLHLLFIGDNLCNVFAFKIARMAIEPEEIEKEESWDVRKPEAKGVPKDPFTQQRDRLRKALDRNDILTSLFTPVNVQRTFEKKYEEELRKLGIKRHSTNREMTSVTSEDSVKSATSWEISRTFINSVDGEEEQLCLDDFE